MKSTHVFRNKTNAFDSEDSLKKAAKLDPIKKSGKEKHSIYSQLNDDEDDAELLSFKKKESILDYFDNGEEEEQEER